MLKVIANPYIFANFSEVDPTNGSLYKGIDLLDESIKWMNTVPINYRCDSISSITKIFCSSFENYIDYDT